ncbi:RAB11-binding protein RELCH homolog isoform X1 [Euwallacea similis]|uniref:RAB11-binding protein RELCH homolog isoform X1 n=1 Tax=Euwallacea similis TaxID=1736056 RepID=UPI00344DAC5F
MSLAIPNCDNPEPKQLDPRKREKSQISYNHVAEKLLEDKFLLTALELHTELVEAGKELKVLRDFFSNPGNFETFTQEFTTTKLSRSGSQATLDSLDLTRYSEDGAMGDERVAVLEFELRKAKETINALRNNLTFAIESETSTPDKGSLRNVAFSMIKPHEQRALNFLINEYLLLQGYKLTSITFADENQNQDFDDWDDVGLNISKPPELIHLYREGLKQSGQSGVTVSTQTDFSEEKEGIIQEQICEIEKLKSKVYFLEADLQDLQVFKEQLQSEQPIQDEDLKDITDIKTSEIGDSPERFEIIDKSMVLFKRSSDLEDNVSNNSLNTSEWAKISIPEPDFKDTQLNYCAKEREFKDLSMETYVKNVYNLCYIDVDDQPDCSMPTIMNKDMDFESLIHAISESLLKIIPNVILNKREEVIPLLMSAIYFNPKASERDKLLHQLFHLKKRPCENERYAILSAVIGIAKKAEEQLVENEILPQCWLQLTHKYIERRLLVAQACTVLIPYVSSPIRNSLILSMLQQMLEDKEDEVREQIIRALTLLFCHCEDPDKYPQCEQLAFNTFKDASNSVFNVSVQVLFPVLAKWALQAGYLTSSLFKKLLHRLNEHIRNLESQSKTNQEIDRIQRVLAVIDILLPFLVTSVAYHEDVTNDIKKEVVPIRSDFSNLCSNKLTNPESFVKSDFYVGTVLHEFDKFIADNPNSSWASMDWVVDEMLPDLLNNVHHIDLAQQSLLQGFLNLFAHISIVFGHNFTKYKIRPIVQKNIQNVEQVISSFNQFCPSLNVIPIYVTMLRLTKDLDEISSIMKRFLCALPLCGSPLDCLEITVKKLCEAGLQNVVVECLWSGVVHQRPLVKSAAASLFCSIIGTCSEDLLKSNVAGAIVTLASDSDILVRTATIPALGRLITNCSVKEIHDKAYMQLQTFAVDPSLKENHTLSRQLIVTLGNIFVGSCRAFRNDVILPQLTNFAIFMSQMTNQTRKIDMALALLEAFTHVVYSPLNNQNVSSVIRSGLKSLELVISENPSLSHHHETVLAMLKECDNKCNQSIPGSPVGRSSHFGHNVNQGVEEMRQRVTKIFNKPSMPKSNTLPNLSGIFKKK